MVGVVCTPGLSRRDWFDPNAVRTGFPSGYLLFFISLLPIPALSPSVPVPQRQFSFLFSVFLIFCRAGASHQYQPIPQKCTGPSVKVEAVFCSPDWRLEPIYKLIIAEKGELARAIADAIPGQGRSDGKCIIKGEYRIVWCSGHLLTLKEPEDYDAEKYGKWNMEQLPIFFPHWGQKATSAQKMEKLRYIGEMLKGADGVIHAGDCDDEGQLIVDEVLRWHKYNGPVMRINTSDTTAPMLRKALASMTNNTIELQRSGWAAYARSVSDALVGFNLSRAMTVSNPGSVLTIGRVQTPTLGLVVNRDAQIEGHKKLKYYTVEADVTMSGRMQDGSMQPVTFTAEYVPDAGNPNLTDGKILDANWAKSMADFLSRLGAIQADVEKKDVYEAPPLPFNLTKLTTFCSTRFGIDNVMEITQSLRDKYKAITYNRTDCQYLGDEHFKQAAMVLEHVKQNLGMATNPPKGLDPKIRSKCFDQSKISVHFAIIPTATNVDLNALTDAERKVYLAICYRYMMQFMPPAHKERTIMTSPLADGGKLRASATRIVEPGYLIFDRAKAKEDAEKEGKSSALLTVPAGKGQHADVSNGRVRERETAPPPRYTIATLEEDMSRIAKYVVDPEAKKLLIEKDRERTGENGSIGTTATRESIIRTLIKNEFLREDGKKLISTPKGRALYNAMPDEFRLADTTAKWWVVQEDIKEGRAKPDDLILTVFESVKRFLSAPIPKVAYEGQNAATHTPVGVCPVCGGTVVTFAKGFVCQNYKKEDGACHCYLPANNPKFLPLSKHTITEKEAKALFSGQSIIVKKAPRKDGKGTYSAQLQLDVDQPTRRLKWKLSIAQKETLGACPACGGKVIEGRTGYGCMNYKADPPCKFYVPRINTKFSPLQNHRVTAAEMKKLLAGKPITVKNIPKKNGTGTYDAKLTLRWDGKYPAWDMSFLPSKKAASK